MKFRGTIIFSVGICVVFCLLSLVNARLVKEQVAAYEKIIGTNKLTADGLIKLLTLHDSDTVCVGACRR